MIGLLDTRDEATLRTLLRDQNPADIFATVDMIRSDWNGLMDELLRSFSFRSTDHQRIWGDEAHGKFRKADEYSRVTASRVTVASYTIGFPLEKYQDALGWTREFFMRETFGELVRQFNAKRTADYENIILAIKTALFLPTNYTFKDDIWGNLNAVALLNADGQYIPPYAGRTFNAGTHTHYLTNSANGGATVSAATFLVMQNHLTEHGHRGNLVCYIAPEQEGGVRALTPDFVPTPRFGVVVPNATVAVVSSDPGAIGRILEFEIRVREWMPAGYLFAYNEYGDNSEFNPIHYRISDIPEWQGMYIAAEEERFPLRAQWIERRFGFSVRTRTNGVVMQLTSSGTYSAPATTVW